MEPPQPRRTLHETLQAEQQVRPSEAEQEAERPRVSRRAGPFSRGNTWISLILGQGRVDNTGYLIIGAGARHFVVDGLALGGNYDVWLGGEPTIHRIAPEVMYVLHFTPVIKPYVGGFLRHTFIESIPDFDSLGARGGLIYPLDPLLFGIGISYETLLECNGDYQDCDVVNPEIFVGASF